MATLLEKAKEAGSDRITSGVSAEEVELGIAWMTDEVSLAQVQAALELPNSGNVYSRLAAFVREAYRIGIIEVDGSRLFSKTRLTTKTRTGRKSVKKAARKVNPHRRWTPERKAKFSATMKRKFAESHPNPEPSNNSNQPANGESNERTN